MGFSFGWPLAGEDSLRLSTSNDCLSLKGDACDYDHQARSFRLIYLHTSLDAGTRDQCGSAFTLGARLLGPVLCNSFTTFLRKPFGLTILAAEALVLAPRLIRVEAIITSHRWSPSEAGSLGKAGTQLGFARYIITPKMWRIMAFRK